MRKILRLLVPILALAFVLQGCDSDSDTPAVESPADPPAECDPACADGESCVDGACVAADPGDDPVSCTPDAELACTCDDGAEGVQKCNDAGDGYGECFCTTSPVDPPTEDCDPACAEGESCVDGECAANRVPEPEPADPHCHSFADVTVVFEDNGCLGCHGSSGGLSLGTHADTIAKVVTSGDGANSTLVTKLKTATLVSGSVMPLGNADSVPDADIELLIEWIDGGAPETCD